MHNLLMLTETQRFSAGCPLNGHVYLNLQLKAAGLFSLCDPLVDTRH